MAALDDLFDPRRHARLGSSARGELRGGDWNCGSVELTEISSGGFRAICDEAFAVGSLVRVSIPGLGFRTARVKWSNHPTFGAEFCNPADLRLLFLGAPVESRPAWIERLAA